ncbi:hypothetical protein E2C01_086764 [Portunus trituberculatus]|uniref:Uncharacterized protein n=1 Tax=Portunus trituberculatus TaxID=210409 RepID=A0A5B7JFI1_PORTR|nr:hypothetical protein [Portunus trituberculatus]
MASMVSFSKGVSPLTSALPAQRRPTTHEKFTLEP